MIQFQFTGFAILSEADLNSLGAAGIAVANNQPMTGSTPRNVVIEHNTIYNTKGECLRLTSVAADKGWVVSNNALYCASSIAITVASGALTGKQH